MKLLDQLTAQQRQCYDAIAAELAGHGISIRINRNKRTLISVRHQRDGSYRMSFHYQLLDYPAVQRELIKFGRKGGHGRYPRLDEALYAVFDAQHEVALEAGLDDSNADVHALQPIGEDFDFEACFEGIYSAYFDDLRRPAFGWARDPGDRQLRSIRFGAYYSDRRQVLLNPRLAQPWVARLFIEHIIHHECCHHRQAMDPKRGETAHSPRFKRWEAAFHGYDLARRWEQVFIRRLLAAPSELAAGFQESFLG